MSIGGQLARGFLIKQLEENARRRQAGAREYADARIELADLLRKGLSLPEPMTVTEMCALAGVRRETGHQILRGNGQPRFLHNELGGSDD